MKKIIVLTTCISMVFASVFNVYAADFSDVKQTNWSYEAVSVMSEKAVITGYPDGSFKPGNTVTYGEFIKMALIASTGEDVGNAASGNWAEEYYKEALNLGYFTEYDIKNTLLDREITRAHMALIISSILGDVKLDNYTEIQKGISDITYKTAYEYDITKAYATGILTGYTDKTFQPGKTLSRAEAATVIYRLVDESKRVLPGMDVEPKEQKTIITSAASGNQFEATLIPAKLGDSYGIAKVKVVQHGYVAMYSTIRYEFPCLIIDDILVSGFVNPNGNTYWEEDGYYVYYAQPKKDGIDVTGKTPSILIDGEKNIVITLTDTKL